MTGVDRTLQGSYGSAHSSLGTKGCIAVSPRLKSALETTDVVFKHSFHLVTLLEQL